MFSLSRGIFNLSHSDLRMDEELANHRRYSKGFLRCKVLKFGLTWWASTRQTRAVEFELLRRLQQFIQRCCGPTPNPPSLTLDPWRNSMRRDARFGFVLTIEALPYTD